MTDGKTEYLNKQHEEIYLQNNIPMVITGNFNEVRFMYQKQVSEKDL